MERGAYQIKDIKGIAGSVYKRPNE